MHLSAPQALKAAGLVIRLASFNLSISFFARKNKRSWPFGQLLLFPNMSDNLDRDFRSIELCQGHLYIVVVGQLLFLKDTDRD